jgi:hypothetical protein
MALYPGFWILTHWKPQSWTQLGLWAGSVVFVFVATFVVCLRKAMGHLTRNRADRLGYLGEREVAERLMPLWTKGYQVFHDVPAKGTKDEFNIDHVTIGRTGVAVIETKTRRKGKRRADGSEYKVRYDGEKLLWPWGPDDQPTKQALALADWTTKFVHERTGISLRVKPIIAIPGWWVDPRPGPVSVVNAKSVASAVESHGEHVLSEAQVDLIARQFDERCRDVED